MISIDSLREQIERELAPPKPKSEPKKPSAEFFTKEDCGDHLKLIWKG